MRCGEFRTSYAADMAIFETPLATRLLAAFLGLLALVPIFATTYWLDVANRIGIAIIGAVGINILTGFTGQVSLGNAAFLAVGAYSTAAIGTRWDLPWLAIVPLSGLITAAVGMVFGVPSLRLKGLYLGLATLAAHFIVEFTAVHWEALTGGVNGISIPAARLFTLTFDSDRSLYYAIFPVMVALVFFAKNLFRTKVGKAFVAIRDQDISAEVMGVEVFRFKLLAFGVSSFYVGVAGSLLAYQARIISPENFPLLVAIDQLGMIIIGGLGSILGSILGAVFWTFLNEGLRLMVSALSGQFPGLVQQFAPLRLGVFGLIVILFLVFEPDGLAAIWRRIRNWFRLYPFSY